MKIISRITLLCFIVTSIFANFTYVLAEEKTRIAVMNLRAEGVSSVVANAVSEFLRNDLIDTNKYIVIERTNMEQILAEQMFQSSGCTTQECAVELGKILNVQKVIVGSVIKLDKDYYINARLVDIISARIERSERQVCSSQRDLTKASRTIAASLTGTKLDMAETEIKPEMEAPPRAKKPKKGLMNSESVQYDKYLEWKKAVKKNKSGIKWSKYAIVYGGLMTAGYLISGGYDDESSVIATIVMTAGGILFLKRGNKRKDELMKMGRQNNWIVSINKENEIRLAYNVYWK